MDTLKKRSDFLAVAKGGRVGRRAFVVQGLSRDDTAPPRVGYTVTKKTGNSVARSRIKRRLRAAVAALDHTQVPQKADFVLVARDRALSLPFESMIADLKSGMAQALDPSASQRRGKPWTQNKRSKKPPTPRNEQG